MVTANPILPILVGISLVIIIVNLILRKFKQTHVISYIIAGLILGKSGLGLINDESFVSSLGSIGLILLLFFVGLEINFKTLVANWKLPIIGTIIQIVASISAIWIFGSFFQWGLQRIIFLGFVVSLSSTAVVHKILEEWKEINTKTGQNVISILVTHDFAIIPMLMILGFFVGQEVNYGILGLQVIGMILIFTFLWFIAKNKEFHLPFLSKFKKDHEMQIFIALFLCFGFSMVTWLFGLSTALGAFLAGILISAAKETKWISHTLHPFRSFFIPLFFISIGMLIDTAFFLENVFIILGIVGIVFLTNTFINAFMLMLLNNHWRDSLYAGSLLSPIGELSFLLIAVGLEAGIISTFGYQLTIEVIAITLLLSPLWIAFIKKVICHVDHFSSKIPKKSL